MANRAVRRRLGRAGAPLVASLWLAVACGFDRSDRWLEDEPPPPECQVGQERCQGAQLMRCRDGAFGPELEVERDCATEGQVCVPELLDCRPCRPGATSCQGNDLYRCDADGQGESYAETCDLEQELVCREGRCTNLCDDARERRSNVGCHYWAVDLDNADVADNLSGASQQFAVVVSNPHPDITSEVVIEQDDSKPGEESDVSVVARASIPPLNLRVFKLGPREVDGSAPGTFDTGTNTALTRNAYRIRSNFPVVAYQFNPLENVNVFSNEASLLKPVEAVDPGGQSLSPMYTVLGWPQTIASTDDPDTNFDPNDPTDLRAFLTLVGTRKDTHVRVRTTARILGGGPIPDTAAGEELTLTLQPFEVANLETDDFNADFTGSLVYADGPVIAFSGSEASDAPFFQTLSERRCCADHLEEQLDHVRTAGERFVATVSPNRSKAIRAAGAPIGETRQYEYFRVIAATDEGADVRTTLPGDDGHFTLSGAGDFVDLRSDRHFILRSDHPVQLGAISPSQADTDIPSEFPGGDPSFLIVPPVEQFRENYVFLTPDKYNFDFIRIIAPREADVALDNQRVAELSTCIEAAADGLTDEERGEPPEYVVYTCQLAFPVIDPTKSRPENITPGLQNDGVHRVVANVPVGVLVDGFDHYVSYAYAAGTELEFLVPPL